MYMTPHPIYIVPPKYTLEKYILLQYHLASLSKSKLILLEDTKKYKLADAQTCTFLHVSPIKIS